MIYFTVCRDRPKQELGQRSVSIMSQSHLEITATSALVRTLKVCQMMTERMEAVLQHGESLDTAINADYSDLNVLGRKIFQVQNLTEAQVEFWIASEGQMSSMPMRHGKISSQFQLSTLFVTNQELIDLINISICNI